MGRPNAQLIAGSDAGTKLMELRRLAAKGHVVTVISEAQFWRLVDATSRSRKAGRAGARLRGTRYRLTMRHAAEAPMRYTSPAPSRPNETACGTETPAHDR